MDQSNQIGTNECKDPATPADTIKNPCAEKLHVDSLVKNAIISAQNVLINEESTTNEYGASHNLASWPGNTYLQTPVTTQGLTNSFTPTFSWDLNNGFTTGFSHGHPAGTGPDYLDVIPMIGNYSNPNLQAATAAARTYYQNNVSSTVLTTNGDVVITVNNWSALQTVYSSYLSNPTTFKSKFQQDVLDYRNANNDATAFEAYEYALLTIFGNSINLYTTTHGSTDYDPIVIDSTDQVATKGCPQ